MAEENKKPAAEEEDTAPLTEEELKEYQEKDKRTEKKFFKVLRAIWDAVNFFH